MELEKMTVKELLCTLVKRDYAQEDHYRREIAEELLRRFESLRAENAVMRELCEAAREHVESCELRINPEAQTFSRIILAAEAYRAMEGKG